VICSARVNILRFLKDQAKDYDCNVCGQNHSKSEIRVLGRLESAWIVRVTCSRCQTSFKLLVVVDEARSGMVPMRESATQRPARRRQRDPVTLDEVLDAHEFLKEYGGDFKSLFRRQRSTSTSGRSGASA
jgi:hypothetical protein